MRKKPYKKPVEDELRQKVAIAIIIVICAFTLIIFFNNKQKDIEPVTNSNFLMDTLIQISAYGPNSEKAINESFDRINEIQSKMTSKGEDSEVIKINKKAGLGFQQVSPDTFNVIKKGLEYSQISNGSFDITVGSLVKLWGIGTDKVKVPDQNELKKALTHVNYKNVILDDKNHSVMLKKKDMSIDLGAIAKGYAADEVVKVLKRYGIKSAVADLGGNIYVLGKKPDGSLWKIGIQDPYEQRGSNLAVVEVADKTLVTSGIYERFFEKDNIRYHHILDTKTGFPVENNLASVSIISNSSIEADGLSTTAFSLGLKEGLKLIESIPDTEAVFVTKDRGIYTSSGINKYNFNITRPNYKLRKIN